MSAYDELMSFVRTTQALSSVAGRTGWDQETMMPVGAGSHRAEEMAALEEVIHARRTDPNVGEWLSQARAEDEVAVAQLRHIQRSYDRSTKIPVELATAQAALSSKGQGVWVEARKAQDVSHFLPTLTEIVSLKRQEAHALNDGKDAPLYDALMDDYEPDAKSQDIETLFSKMRSRLVALREKVLGAPRPKALTGTFDLDAQLKISRELAKAYKYDFDRGRIDLAVHPFSSGSGTDVRITTRTDPNNPLDCFYSTIHEVGHACYEQNIDPSFAMTPLGSGVSMGVHESQSRIYENQLGRSRAFTGWLYGQMQEPFGDMGFAGPEEFYAAVNRVNSGYIRTEADEIHYNLHIMLRFDLERDLIEGRLNVEDLEEAWNARFEADFGEKVDKPSNGVLQDIHWSAGLFGYFPTYSLGNVYAGCLYHALRKAVPDVDDQLALGDLTASTNWLKHNLQQYGGLYTPTEVIAKASGQEPTSEPLLDYLEAKFSELYSL